MVLQVACGTFHTMCILDDQNVYAWGAGSAGRLGVGGEGDTPIPTLVEGLQDKGIQSIQVGRRHVLAAPAKPSHRRRPAAATPPAAPTRRAPRARSALPSTRSP